MRTLTSPASETQLQQVRRALDEFRTHWHTFLGMPPKGNFAGTLEDVRALDYLHYEGLGYPPSGVHGAALVWGNVLACQLEMRWATDSQSNLLLTTGHDAFRITVWPYARVFEVQERSLPQFERYFWLLEGVIRDCLDYGDLSERALAWAESVITKNGTLPCHE
jgi:hypothetical protein